MPKIGRITGISEDGTYEQGPILGTGGPFDTAAEFYTAWSTIVEFGLDEPRLQQASGQYLSEIKASISSFQESIKKLAAKIPARNHGPFPLCHGDSGHNNIIVDNDYRILGVIDWEHAFAAPWEIAADFPLSLMIMPRSTDAPWNYDEDGNPVGEDLVQKYADQKTYFAAVAKEEADLGEAGDYSLARAMQDSGRQHLATAMHMFENGKAGLYVDQVYILTTKIQQNPPSSSFANLMEKKLVEGQREAKKSSRRCRYCSRRRAELVFVGCFLLISSSLHTNKVPQLTSLQLNTQLYFNYIP